MTHKINVDESKNSKNQVINSELVLNCSTLMPLADDVIASLKCGISQPNDDVRQSTFGQLDVDIREELPPSGYQGVRNFSSDHGNMGLAIESNNLTATDQWNWKRDGRQDDEMSKQDSDRFECSTSNNSGIAASSVNHPKLGLYQFIRNYSIKLWLFVL
jgi:hypothetical protein